jgi:solute carrier family 4 (sodium bicarbonate transporter), member 10
LQTDQVPQQQPLISPSSTSQMLRNVSSSDFQGLDHHRINFNFMRKIPPGAEASNILVGEVDFLTKTLSAFIRLSSAAIMGDLTEVPVPTRYEKTFFHLLKFNKKFISI